MRVVKVNPTSARSPSNAAFPSLERPVYADILKFPDDITALTSRQVSALYGKYVAMHAYALTQLSEVSQEILRAEGEIDITRSHLMRNFLNTTHPKWEIEAIVANNAAIRSLTIALTKLKVKRQHISTYSEVFDKYAAALSRELSRKATEMQRTVRGI
jgi:hypothetical protein